MSVKWCQIRLLSQLEAASKDDWIYKKFRRDTCSNVNGKLSKKDLKGAHKIPDLENSCELKCRFDPDASNSQQPEQTAFAISCIAENSDILSPKLQICNHQSLRT